MLQRTSHSDLWVHAVSSSSSMTANLEPFAFVLYEPQFAKLSIHRQTVVSLNYAQLHQVRIKTMVPNNTPNCSYFKLGVETFNLLLLATPEKREGGHTKPRLAESCSHRAQPWFIVASECNQSYPHLPVLMQQLPCATNILHYCRSSIWNFMQ